MASSALTTASRFPVRRERPNRPAVDNASRRSWCPHFGVRFTTLRLRVRWLWQRVFPSHAYMGYLCGQPGRSYSALLTQRLRRLWMRLNGSRRRPG